MTTESRFRVMGTDAHVVAVGGSPRLLDRARARLDDFERRWSRFRPDSELSRLNAAGGTPVRLSADTFDLVGRAVDAWRLTGGRFDPTVCRALEAAGYDRTFAEVAAAAAGGDPGGGFGPAVPVPGCAGVAFVVDTCTVLLPPGVALDLGGIGKGYAADLLVRDVIEWGAAGACVNLGGDVRVLGESPDGERWVVAVDDPADATRELFRVGLADGAVVTSTRLFRRWRRAGREHHHLIDPASGQSAFSGLATVSVVGAEASWSEVFAKAAYLAGADEGHRLLAGAGMTGAAVTDEGELRLLPGMEAFLPCTTT